MTPTGRSATVKRLYRSTKTDAARQTDVDPPFPAVFGCYLGCTSAVDLLSPTKQAFVGERNFRAHLCD